MSSKNINIVASWRIEHCHTGNFSLPVLIFKYLNLKNCLASFVQNCKTYSKEVLVNKINWIINSVKFSCSYESSVFCVPKKWCLNTYRHNLWRYVFRHHFFGTQDTYHKQICLWVTINYRTAQVWWHQKPCTLSVGIPQEWSCVNGIPLGIETNVAWLLCDGKNRGVFQR